MSAFHLLLLVALLASVSVSVAELCTTDVCEYEFNVSMHLTMTAYAPDTGNDRMVFLQPNGALAVKNWTSGELYPPPESMSGYMDKTLVIDGFYRNLMAVNGQVPGPTIEVYEGAQIVVHVRNQLYNSAVTFHWHGQYQKGTPWEDGVAMVTQCGILPGQDFTYRFVAAPSGTLSWHAHLGLERPDGLFGAVIVHKRPGEPDMRNEVCDEGSDAHIMTLSEYYHRNPTTMYENRVFGSFTEKNDTALYPWSRMTDGRMASENPFVAALVNGRGRYQLADGSWSRANLTVFDVQPGANTTCFRIVGAMMEKVFRLEIDGHTMTVFATDGSDTDPFETDFLVVNQGETYDISVPTPATTNEGKNFFIRVKTLEDHSNTGTPLHNEGWAVLRYPGAPEEDPTTTSKSCTGDAPCRVLGCPFLLYPKAYNLTCFPLTTLRAANADPVPVYPEDQRVERFYNWEFNPLGISRIRFKNPSAPLLTQYSPDSITPCPSDCAYRPKGCQCTNIQSFNFNASVRMVLTNQGPASYGVHPVHLHGHRFRVLKMAYPPTDPITGLMSLSNENHDIACVNGTQCAITMWANNTVPSLNYDRPIVKNTVIVPAGGYTVIEFVTDNPGYWHMHCHMTGHLVYGMAMVVAVTDHLDLFPPPPDFPKCHSMPDVGSSYIEQSADAYKKLMGGGSAVNTRRPLRGAVAQQL